MNKSNIIQRIGWRRLLPIGGALLVLLVTTAIFVNDWRILNSRDQDMPPVIEFTWSPLGTVDLKEFRGHLKIEDDYGLDFTTYRMRIVEMNKTYDLPIPGMMGKTYESPISLGLLLNNPDIVRTDQLTIQFSISDDQGQEAKLERVVKIKPAPIGQALQFKGDDSSTVEVEGSEITIGEVKTEVISE